MPRVAFCLREVRPPRACTYRCLLDPPKREGDAIAPFPPIKFRQEPVGFGQSSHQENPDPTSRHTYRKLARTGDAEHMEPPARNADQGFRNCRKIAAAPVQRARVLTRREKATPASSYQCASLAKANNRTPQLEAQNKKPKWLAPEPCSANQSSKQERQHKSTGFESNNSLS